jgi:hypothetical protein
MFIWELMSATLARNLWVFIVELLLRPVVSHGT